jgi:dihydroorotate dehydrogenase
MLTKFLHLLPPEDAHRVALLGLRAGLAPKLRDNADLSFTIFGKKARNPVGLSAGADKAAVALRGWSDMGFGIVEAGTVTVNPRDGNPQPRCWRFGDRSSIVNWMGLPGEGVESFAANLRAFEDQPQRRELIVGASLASPDGKLAEFTLLAEECSPFVDYVTLNASCPNVAHGSNTGTPEKTAADQIKACRCGAGGKPTLLKLGPTRDRAVLERMVAVAVEAGADGFVATNTLGNADRNMAKDLSIQWPQYDGNPVGGYSGPSLLPISTWMVQVIRELVGKDMPIIGVGGIQSGGNAMRMMEAGANAVQLYTGLIYKGPVLVREILQTMEKSRRNSP